MGTNESPHGTGRIEAVRLTVRPEGLGQTRLATVPKNAGAWLRRDKPRPHASSLFGYLIQLQEPAFVIFVTVPALPSQSISKSTLSPTLMPEISSGLAVKPIVMAGQPRLLIAP